MIPDTDQFALTAREKKNGGIGVIRSDSLKEQQ